MRLIDLMKDCIEHQKCYVKIRTYYNYLQIANCYVANDLIGNKDVKKIKKENLNDFIMEKYTSINQKTNKELSYSTIVLIKGVINRTMKYAYENKYINELVLANVKIKKKKKEKVEALTKEEQAKIEKYIITKRQTYRYGIIICLYTGLRIGELLSLKWSDIDMKKKVICVNSTTYRTYDGEKSIIVEDTPKTESSIREIPLVNVVISLMKELKKFQNEESEFVISRARGKKIECRAYEKSWETLLKKLNIKHYKFHVLRHTFATRALEVGVDIKTLSEILGHSNPTVTLNTYVHTDYNLKKNAINRVVKKFSYLDSVESL